MGAVGGGGLAATGAPVFGAILLALVLVIGGLLLLRTGKVRRID
ncbi:MAG TPA: hypothetical protein VJ831_13785 [Jatrophihabitantaceae bacterium]|nr:hypothetical protein [Jatrophihabitantaceae bacterium]